MPRGVHHASSLWSPAFSAASIGRCQTPRHKRQIPSGLWASLDHHTTYSARDPDAALRAINTALAETRDRAKAFEAAFESASVSTRMST